MSALAPITVKRLDAKGGTVAVDGTACYDGLKRWDRRVVWNSKALQVSDEVALAEGKEEIVLFRWHLGTEEAVVVEQVGSGWEVRWPAAKMAIFADTPVSVTQVRLPDNTLAGHTGGEAPGNYHTCVVVQSAGPVTALKVTMDVSKEG
ncbi:MAG: hypothetical protein HYV26_15695 [Candidatus Hydrogenedentes bacterium]|nr:hypothetical protein [Candidatus Hydrogenedentota bacterium]